MDTFPVLRTERLELVEIEACHSADLYKLFSDKLVTAFYPVVPINEEKDMFPIIESLKLRFEEKQGIRWGIALKGTKEVIGIIGFHTYTEGHKASIVFAMQPLYHNKGYMTEAIKEVLQFGFKELGLKRIEAEVMPGNMASEKVLKNTGFSYEGLLHQWMLWNGQYYDINMYFMLG